MLDEKPKPEKVPEPAPRDDVRVVGGLRCPFCHSEVKTASEEWVACRECLARHHAACWGESAKCAACGHDQKIAAPPVVRVASTGGGYSTHGGAPIAAIVASVLIAALMAGGLMVFVKQKQRAQAEANARMRAMLDAEERARREAEAERQRRAAEELARRSLLLSTNVSEEVLQHYRAGLAALEAKKLEVAQDELSLAWQLSGSRFAEALAARALAREGRGDVPGAVDDLEKALAKAPDAPAAAEWQARLERLTRGR